VNLISFDLFLPFQQWLDPNKRVLQQLKGKYFVTFREFFIFVIQENFIFLAPGHPSPPLTFVQFQFVVMSEKQIYFFQTGIQSVLFFKRK
jgi:hypothetical protein